MIMSTEKIVEKIVEFNPQTNAEFERAKTKAAASLHLQIPSNRELLQAYHTLTKLKRITPNDWFAGRMHKAAIRNLSGIAVITSLVKPYTCPGKCVYCPTEVRMPKSYIATEPAAARALRLDFSPSEQMRQRIISLEQNGHNVDKIEFIIKGGTWNAYPLRYQYWFMYESFRAANLAKSLPAGKASSKPLANSLLNEESPLEDLRAALKYEQLKNETAKHRLIGITLETRPDAIKPKTIAQMREQGCTRVELGLQAPDDAILKLIVRGHTVEQFRDAMLLLRRAGFKVDLHFMPDLPGTTPEHDVEMYKSLFTDIGLKPDMVKIYPNTVIKSAEIYQWYLDGRYKPYGVDNLFNALLQMKLATPRYCRISRLIRDIPETEIEAGNKITNLREALSKELTKRGEVCVCLRCREIGRQLTNLKEQRTKSKEPILFVEKYETIGGTEYFLSFEDANRIAVYGFLRLRLPTKDERQKTNDELFKLISEIKNCAFVRELHVYGKLVKIGDHPTISTQHTGLGKSLMKAAENIAHENDFKKMAVISGVGVRGYYRKLGYRRVGTYMIKSI